MMCLWMRVPRRSGSVQRGPQDRVAPERIHHQRHRHRRGEEPALQGRQHADW